MLLTWLFGEPEPHARPDWRGEIVNNDSYYRCYTEQAELWRASEIANRRCIHGMRQDGYGEITVNWTPNQDAGGDAVAKWLLEHPGLGIHVHQVGKK